MNSDGLNNERYHKRINIKKKKKTKKKNKKKKKKKIAQGKDKPAGGLIIAGLQGGCKDFWNAIERESILKAFLGLDVGAIKRSIAKSWQANNQFIVDA